jgi:hypothetical protein
MEPTEKRNGRAVKKFGLVQISQPSAASYTMGIGYSFLGVERLGRETDLSLLSSAEVKIGGAVSPLPTHIFMTC